MGGTVSLSINGRDITADGGSRLIDSVRKAGFPLAMECSTGRCDSCRVSITRGAVEPAGSALAGSVLACQATVTGDAAISVDPRPREMKTPGTIRSIQDLSHEIVEIVVEVNQPIPYLPGQSVKIAIGSLPERDLCPTLSLDGLREIDTLIFHMRRDPDGVVSAGLSRSGLVGKRVRLRGPFGGGFLRQGEGRLVLVSSGTGFAPLWSIAVAARLGQPHRPLGLIASARDPRNLYMRPAFDWLARHGVTDMQLTASAAAPMPPAKSGRASAWLPALVPSDTVHAAGCPDMVRAIQLASAKAGARCHAIPFLAAEAETGIGTRFQRLFQPKGRIAAKG